MNRSGTSGFYWVRFMKGTDNPVTGKRQSQINQKTFADIKCGGQNEALRQAILWRDKIVKDLKISLDLGQHSHRKCFAVAQSDTGIVGVNHCIDTKQLANGGFSKFYAYRAAWSEGERGERIQRSKNFGYKFGDEAGKKLALSRAKRYRNKMVKIHYDFQRTKTGKLKAIK